MPGRAKSAQALAGLGARAGLTFLDHLLEPPLETVELDPADAEPLGPARRASRQLDGGRLHAEGFRQERAALVVGPPALWRRRHPHLERVAVPTHHGRSPCARLHVDVQHHIGSRVVAVAVLGRNLEQVVDHGRVL